MGAGDNGRAARAVRAAPGRRGARERAQVRHHVAQGAGVRHHGAGSAPAGARRGAPAPPPQPARLRAVHGEALRRGVGEPDGRAAVAEAHGHAHAPLAPAGLHRRQPRLQDGLHMQGSQGHGGFYVALRPENATRPVVPRRVRAGLRRHRSKRPHLGPCPRVLERQQGEPGDGAVPEV